MEQEVTSEESGGWVNPSAAALMGYEDEMQYARAIAQAEAEALRAEIAERDARVVAWLRFDAARWKTEGYNLVACMAIHKAADAIERGEHRAALTPEQGHE